MSNRTLLVAFGLVITAASITSAYFSYDARQLAQRAYYNAADAAENAQKAARYADGAERAAKDLRYR
jgi:uncharacterized protein (UPF0333 family)